MWMWWRRKPRSLGQRGEDLAAKRLRREGYRIAGRNIRAGRFELDIVAWDRDTLVFVEVRTRASADPVPPEDSVGPQKRRHLLEAARWYLAQAGEAPPYYRFDVVAIVMPDTGKAEITLIKDAFQEA